MPAPDLELVEMMVIALVMAYHADEYLAECISKKNQFALFAFQRTLHLLAAFCGTIFLKLCNQKTRFILRLI